MHQIADLITEKIDPEQIFELLDILGQGSYGSVFKALHKQTGELYAIKILPATSGVEISAIKKQIGVLKQCDDDHIVRYYGSYYKDGNLWIIMEYCVAGSVTDIIQITKKKLNENQIASILESALKGLSYIHSKKKIHRDIKAANVLLDQKGYAKLADFGVSASSIYTNDRFKTHIGSPYWMSPEIIKYTEYNHKTDIWSLGITTIQLAEGQVPNSHIKPFMVIFMTKSNPVQGFTNPSLWSPELKNFVSLCLQINPQNRPEAKDLLEHEFIKKNSKGQRLLQQLVLSSLEQIQQFRMNQSRNSSFVEIIVDGGKGDTKTIVENNNKGSDKNGAKSHQQYSQNEGNSMVILSSRHSVSETGSVVINGSMIINEGQNETVNDRNMLTDYINQLKGFSNTQMQYQQIKTKLVEQIESLDKRCQEQVHSVFLKFKEEAEKKIRNYTEIFNAKIQDKSLEESYESKLQKCNCLKDFILNETEKKKLSNNIEFIQQEAPLVYKQKLPQMKHNQSATETRQQTDLQPDNFRKESESFMNPKNRMFEKKTYIQTEVQPTRNNPNTQQRHIPSHNSSRILFKNPNHHETPSSIPKKIQQFKEDPDVLEYLQKTFGATQSSSNTNLNNQKGSVQRQKNYNGTKLHTQSCLKQQKSTEHSISRGKNLRSSKNIKSKKSKNKIK